jgi:5'-3' exonuclease
MGIRCLTRWIEWACKDVIQPVDWSSIQGRIGVDALSLLYRAKMAQNDPVEQLASWILQMRQGGIEPVFVFDGKSPREKERTRLLRNKQRGSDETSVYVHTDDRNRVKQFLYAAGVLFLNAEGEADSVLAYLARMNYITAVVSGDLDFLPRGVRRLILPDGPPNGWREINLVSILQRSQLSYDQFVRMCVLLGSDYNPSIPTISWQSAYWSQRYGDHDLIACLKREGIRNPAAWIAAERILRGEEDRWEDLLSEKQRAKWEQGALPIEESLCDFVKDEGLLRAWCTISDRSVRDEILSTRYLNHTGGSTVYRTGIVVR